MTERLAMRNSASSTEATAYFDRLMGIAKQSRVKVKFLPGDRFRELTGMDSTL